MDDIHVVKVLKSLGNDFEKLFGFWLEESVFWLREKVIVEGIGTTILQNQKYFSRGFDCFQQLRNDRIVQNRKNVYFPF